MHLGFCWENGGLSVHIFPRGLRVTLTLTCPALSMRGRGLGRTAPPRGQAGALGRTPSPAAAFAQLCASVRLSEPVSPEK